jgi:HEAT repeat protein
MSRPGESLTGQTLGSYELTAILGRGSLGVVYAARHTQLGSMCACKVLHRELARDPGRVERFRAEAQRATRVHHPNVIDIFDIGELPDGRIYYVMEQLGGEPLAQVLSGGRLSFAEVVEVGRQLCEGLAAAHAAGVLHHDLRLASIYLLSRPGEVPRVKLADLGLTRVAELSPREAREVGRRQIFGAPENLAPERIRGGDGDERSDVYALGATLYTLCTGRPLFGGRPLGKLLRAHLYAPPPLLDEQSLLAGVPPHMDALLHKALAKRPADRYATVEQREADLLRIGRGEPPLALPYYQAQTRGPVARLRRGVGALRVSRWAGPGLLLLTLAVAGGGYGTARWLAAWSAARHGSRSTGQVDVLALRKLAVDVLKEGLRASEPELRVAALRALGQSRDPHYREALQLYLGDPSPQIRAEAAGALGALGVRTAAPALRRCAQTAADAQTELACAEALDRLDDQAALDRLRKLMTSGEPWVAINAALALEARNEPPARRFLEEKLMQADLGEALRARVLEHRALRGDKQAQSQALALALDHPASAAPTRLQLEVAASLTRLDEQRARALLVKAVEQGGPLQVLAAQLLCTADDLFGQPLLRQVFAEPARPLSDRLLAISGLGSCGDREDLRNLAQSLQHAEPARILRQVEAGSLLRLCLNDPVLLSEQSLSLAMAGLHDDSPLWREAAVAALGESDQQQAVPLLRRALREDSRPEVRRRAARALGRTNQAGAIAALGEAIDDQSPEVRFSVLRSLGDVGASLKAHDEAGLDPALRTRLQKALSDRAESADPAEQVMASATLLRLGDTGQRERLRHGLTNSNSELLQLAIEQTAADPELQRKSLPPLLEHPDFAVRLQAATSLAALGEHSGVHVLREALARGEAHAIRAYGLLTQLGEVVQLPEQWAAPLASTELGTRLAAVEAVLHLPLELALDLLTRASRDPDRAVRRRVVELLGQLPLGSRLSFATSILRRMQDDSDAVVRALSTAILARLLPRSSGAHAAAPPAHAGPTPPADGGAPADLAAPAARPDAGGEPAEPPPTPDAGAAPAAGAGPESGIADDAGARNQALIIHKTISAGLAALKRNELSKAQHLLEKVNSACARSRKEAAAACAEAAWELSLALGRVYEAQQQWALAMREYEKLKHDSGAQPPTPAQRAEVSAAVKRLSPRLGRVIIPTVIHKRCQESVVWMAPGTHTVDLQGKTQQIRVRAQETVKVGQCP